MPELPEVETVVRSIRPHLLGKQILSVSLSSRRVTRADHALTAAALASTTITQIRRQGKQILIDLDKGLLYIHLGMTGKLLWNAEPTRYTRALFELNDGRLVYDDTRMFGRVEFFSVAPQLVSKNGPDALTVSPGDFFQRLQKYRGSIKAVLLNQSFISGVGNIYADEALFAARIHPKTLAHRVSKARAKRLHTHLLEILTLSIESRGSSISDYVDGQGERGSFQHLHNVYGKKDEECPRCKSSIRRIVVAQRGTHYCPRCQRV